MSDKLPARLTRLCSTLLLFAVFISFAIPTLDTLAQTGSAAAINSGRVNVRTGPGVIFTIVTSVPYNTEVTLIGRASTGTWVQIRLQNGTVGWVNSTLLRSYADYSLLPVTYDTSVVVPPQTVPPPGSNPGGTTYYTVRAGDTLATIAARYGTTVQALMTANNIINPNFIYTGQQLVISYGSSPSPQPQPQPNPGSYVVQAGDTLAIIAARYGTSVAAIVTANNLPNANFIYSGQVLIIPGPPPPPRYYTVQTGDNMFRIALRYGTTVAAIQAANNIFNPNAIYVGQTLVIP